METIEVISTDKTTVVIQVNPQVEQDIVICVDGQEARRTSHNAALKGFFKAQPKALGIVQIMIGVMIFILGVVLTVHLNHIPAMLVYSGITYWGSIIYISAGFLSVAAQNKRHPCVFKASLGMNIFSAITAGLAILLMSIQLKISMMGPSLHAESLRIVGILLVFTIPQFIISICISGFACRVSSNIMSTVINVSLNEVV